MELLIYDWVADKIWRKHRVTRDEAMRAWASYLASRHESDQVLYDSRDGRDPPPEWVLVRLNRKVIKLVFVLFDEDLDASAHLVTDYYVDKRMEDTCRTKGGRIHG